VARLVAIGLVAAALAAIAGAALERQIFGADDRAAVARAERDVQERFDSLAATLMARTARVEADADTIRAAAGRDTAAVKALFTRLDATLPVRTSAPVAAGITVFDASGVPLAWSGRVFDPPRERLSGPRALYVTIGATGPRIVRIEPLASGDHPSTRLATIVAEELVQPDAQPTPAPSDTFTLAAGAIDVAIHSRPASATVESPYEFLIRSVDGQLLAAAEVSPDRLAGSRLRARGWTRGTIIGILALTLLLATAPILEWRRHTPDRRQFAAATAVVVAVLFVARLLLGATLRTFFAPQPPLAVELLPNALLAAALVWLSFDVAERRRVARPRVALLGSSPGAWAVVAAGHFVAALVAVLVLWQYQRVLQEVAARSSIDLVQFSLHPVDAERLGIAFGLVMLHAAVIWGAALIVRLPVAVWRLPRRRLFQAAPVMAALAGAAIGLLIVARSGAEIAIRPLAVTTGAALLGSAMLARLRRPARRASQSARLGGLYVALLMPAVAVYPSLQAFASQAKEELVAGNFASQVYSQREDLQSRRLPNALEAINAMRNLGDLVTASDEDAPATDLRAFIVWSRTELATYRTTSAVELYSANGRLISRFALNLPEYVAGTYVTGSCDDWDVYEETSPFGSGTRDVRRAGSTRNVLRASRAICSDQRRIGAIVVRVMLDYRTLPFIAPQNPYLESLAPQRRPEDATGRDVEFVFYGWSRAPLYTSGTGVWPLSDDVFNRMVASRRPFWATVTRGDTRFRVYFFNDRVGIYALGYPLVSLLGHLINLGELVFLAAVLYALLLTGATLFNAVTSQTPASGRALLREVRSSFYRKLFIAFVASAVVPVIVLAVATRTYFQNQFRSGLEDSAEKTATVAQRLIEDYASLQQRGANVPAFLDDQFMVLVRRAIDQDVNLFERARLHATSERDLFASGILPSRTPGTIYQRIALERLPTSIDVEDVGGAPHLLAAAPVRAGGFDGIVTVPQTLREQEIERQIDELDRRVLSAAVLFVLLGAALGYWMAERIADPVNRLTRATRRIARGDLDARIAATSSDELRRLVEDFNRMADDLKQQRRELERTQRLEAWAEMARQVAHDIKNPLTPIQLSAEHARRVNIDRGRPLSPVLDECVSAILSQVTLLRQISAEFSSFASSPTPRPQPTDLAALIDEVVEPYRTGLTGRISIKVDHQRGMPKVHIDRTLFARGLTNVIENALHAMPGGGALVVSSRESTVASSQESEVGSQASGSSRPFCIVVTVRDTGVGMDAAALSRIFEPYFSTKATGTGLGLTIAKRNIELDGGTISVASARGVGTTVTITFPLS
jgi:signal transduction histidine kinase